MAPCLGSPVLTLHVIRVIIYTNLDTERLRAVFQEDMPFQDFEFRPARVNQTLPYEVETDERVPELGERLESWRSLYMKEYALEEPTQYAVTLGPEEGGKMLSVKEDKTEEEDCDGNKFEISETRHVYERGDFYPATGTWRSR